MKSDIYNYIKLLTIFILFPISGYPCTTFVHENNSKQVFGRNYDWNLGDALIMVNKRGCLKRSTNRPNEKGEKAIWTAKYGSVTFNQYGRELPMGGMNEVGLVVEAMALSDTRYPIPDDRPYVGSASQWRQYLLDTCATVAEVIASDREIRISNTTPGIGTHVLVLDRSGDRAAIEFLNGRMAIHTGDDFPIAVLTNDTYARSLKYLRKDSPPIFDNYNSIQRFITAAKRNQACQARTTNELVDFAFGTLASVASTRTQWRIVYDNTDMRVHFRTRTNRKRRSIDISKFDFSSISPVKILDVNADLSGDVAGQFSNYTYESNRNLIGRSYRQTSFLSRIPEERLDAIARFPESFKCY